MAPAIAVPHQPDGDDVQRYQTLLQLRRSGKASESELTELEEVSVRLESEPAPAEFQEAMISLASDRRMLRESMERIEQLLRQPA